jgi:hypothetical protein
MSAVRNTNMPVGKNGATNKTAIRIGFVSQSLAVMASLYWLN